MRARSFFVLSILPILVACGDKQKSESENVKSTSKTDPKSFVVGKWAGIPGWECDDPIVITAEFVSLGSGEKKIPLEIDNDGDVVLGANGPYLTPDFKADTLTYGGSESGDSFPLERCK